MVTPQMRTVTAGRRAEGLGAVLVEVKLRGRASPDLVRAVQALCDAIVEDLYDAISQEREDAGGERSTDEVRGDVP
jgi:hypothetical protein